MAVARGAALVMEVVLVSHVIADMVSLALPSGFVNRLGSGAESSLDVFVSVVMFVCCLLQTLSEYSVPRTLASLLSFVFF